MASRDEIVAFANDFLDIGAYPDYGPMGLQVSGADEVTKIACGVSASRELFEAAWKLSSTPTSTWSRTTWPWTPTRRSATTRCWRTSSGWSGSAVSRTGAMAAGWPSRRR